MIPASTASTVKPRTSTSRNGRVPRARMIAARPAVFTATAAASATAVIAATPSGPAQASPPAMPAAHPWIDPRPPSAKRLRHTEPVLTTCPAAPAATPTSGPPSSPASTIVGVDAVYQLRGPSWTEMRSANTGATTSTSRKGSETVGPTSAGKRPDRGQREREGGKGDRHDRAATWIGHTGRRSQRRAGSARPHGCRSSFAHVPQ